VPDRLTRLLAAIPWRRDRGDRTPPAEDAEARLDEVVAAAREQHRLVTEQAATVLAAETQIRARLARTMDRYEAALSAAPEGSRGSAATEPAPGEAAGARDAVVPTAAPADGRSPELAVLEADIGELRSALAEAAAASDSARDAVARSASLVRSRLLERDRILGRLGEARLEEQSLASVRPRPAPGDAASIEEIGRAIDLRLASARALRELRGVPPDEQRAMLERELERAAAQERAAAADAGEAPRPDEPDRPVGP
jgi:hypothetical protein